MIVRHAIRKTNSVFHSPLNNKQLFTITLTTNFHNNFLNLIFLNRTNKKIYILNFSQKLFF